MANMFECQHEWEESVSSQFSNENFTEVYCDKCHTYGEKNNKTGEVYWPVS